MQKSLHTSFVLEITSKEQGKRLKQQEWRTNMTKDNIPEIRTYSGSSFTEINLSLDLEKFKVNIFKRFYSFEKITLMSLVDGCSESRNFGCFLPASCSNCGMYLWSEGIPQRKSSHQHFQRLHQSVFEGSLLLINFPSINSIKKNSTCFSI